MLVIGIDVLILFCFGCGLVFASYVAACLIPLGRGEGIASIVSTAITAITMVLGYMVMVEMLDRLVG